MYGFFDIQFWLYGIYFLIACIVSIFVPGYIVASRMKIQSKEIQFLLSVVTGLVLWGIQGYIFGYLHVRFATYLYIAGAMLLFFQSRAVFRRDLVAFGKEFSKIDKLVLVLLLIGAVLQTYPTVMSGMKYEEGVRFFHVNATDGVLHLGYIQSMVDHFPPREPGINAPLVNYHYWSDLVVAEFARVWKLPVIHLFYQYFVPLVSLLTGFAVYCLVKIWGGSRAAIRWALFLLYFSGDAAYIFMLILHHRLAFNTPAIDNGIMQFLNMPHAMAKMIFITSLIPLWVWLKEKDVRFGILTIILMAVLTGFKVYYGMFAAIALSFLFASQFVYSLWKKKKQGLAKAVTHAVTEHRFFALLMLAFVGIAACIYFPPNKGSGGLFFAPLEWPKLFLAGGSLDFEGWWLRRQVYEAAGNIKALLVYDAGAVAIALISVYGTRLLGIIPTRSTAKLLGWRMIVFFVPTVLLFNFLGLFTLQESGLFNVYNFFVVSSIMFAFFAAFTLAQLQKIKFVGPVIVAAIVLLTVPRVVNEIIGFTHLYTTQFKLSSLVSNNERNALTYLQENTPKESVIQTHVQNHWDQASPYSVFFAQRQSYLTGTTLLETHNQPTEKRLNELNLLFKAPNAGEFAQKMKQLNIDYVLVKKDKDQNFAFPIDETFLKVMYQNTDFVIVQRTQQ